MATRKFFELTRENKHDCNLTELVAAESTDRGFVTHNDFAWSHVNRYTYVWKLLTSRLKGTKTLLDVGAGLSRESGAQLPYFLWRNKCKPVEGFQYWGIELRATPAYIPAEDKGWQVPLNMVRGDVLESDFTTCDGWPGQFDMVVSLESFEHVPRSHQVEFAKKLFNWTKPGGTCLFSTPNAGVSDTTAENHLDPETGESREWTYDEKLELMDEVGFTVEDTFGTFCGTTRLPEHIQERFKTDPEWAKIKKFLSHSLLTSVISIPWPACSNNSLFHLTRPSC
jgi:hypothetical protein